MEVEQEPEGVDTQSLKQDDEGKANQIQQCGRIRFYV